MRPLATLVCALIASTLVVAAPRDASACGTGFSFFGSGGGGGGLWQRPAKAAQSFEPQTIILMGNEALGIPAGVEVDVWQPPAKQASLILEIVEALRRHGIIVDFDPAVLAANESS